MLIQAILEDNEKASKMAEIIKLYPQVLINAKVNSEKKYDYDKDKEIKESIEKLEKEFAGNGRVLIRPSGTEPLVRVMIEGEDQEYITKKDITNINKIYYEKTLGVLDLSHALKIIYNKDFFILINDDYSIISCIVGNDPRALNEYNEYLSLEKEYASYFDKDGHVKEEAYYR